MQRLALLRLKFQESLLAGFLFKAQAFCIVLFISCRPKKVSGIESNPRSQNQDDQDEDDIQ
jgi:hypothetical protein